MKLIQGPVHTRVEAESAHWSRLCQLLSVQDPERYKNHAFRAGTWDGYHRYYDGVKWTFLSGLLPHVEEMLDEHSIPYEVERSVPSTTGTIAPDLLRGMSLRPYQISAIERMLKCGRGVVRSPPRSGKTVIQAAVCKQLDVPSLLLVERTRLMEQHAKLFQDVGVSDVGVVGNGYRLSNKHTIATVQTLHRGLTSGDPEITKLVRSRELLLVDEAHHQVARTYLDVVGECPAPWRFGLSGTPFHDRGTKLKPVDLWLVGATGPLIFDISSSYLRSLGYLANPQIYMVPITEPAFWDNEFASAYRRGIVTNSMRNQIIKNLAVSLAKEDRRTLILVSRVEHGELLLKAIHDAGVAVAFTWGGSTLSTIDAFGRVTRNQKKHDVLMEELREGKITTLIGSQVLDEGIDIPYLNSVVIAGGMKSPIKVIQRAFRGMTAHAGKTETLIFDFDDHTHAYLRKHSKERIHSYIEEEIDIEMELPSRYVGGEHGG